MKRQYLGDSKDSFKWNYHDYLASAIGFSVFNVVLMLTPDDDSNHGKTHPARFPAQESIIDFCRDLRRHREIQLIKKLPSYTGSKYLVELHQGETYFKKNNRKEYFSGFSGAKRQIVFLDPDNGFEPEKSSNEKHVLYSDVQAILDQISDDTVISVFQVFRRIPFAKDFNRIKERLPSGYATAIYWHSLMFVLICKTKEEIEKVRKINFRYFQQGYPVELL